MLKATAVVVFGCALSVAAWAQDLAQAGAAAPLQAQPVAAALRAADGTRADTASAPATTAACLADGVQADFLAGTPADVDLDSSPGEVRLLRPDVLDSSNTTVSATGFGFTATTWAGQTFLTGLGGQLERIELYLFCSGCTGTTPNITVAVRATSGTPAVPVGPDLATATIAGFNSATGGYYSADFAVPLTLAAGTRYAIVLRAVAAPSAGTYAYLCSCTSPNSNPYLEGQRVTSSNSGGTWTADVNSGGRDLGFRVYVDRGYVTAGNLISRPRDSDPAAGFVTKWQNLSWTGATPPGTGLRFQAAASNSAAGPFNFVGPDGTAASYFSNGAALGQFDGLRYLHYRAYLGTTDTSQTPALASVTTCYSSIRSPDLRLDKSDGGASVAPGGTVAYTLGYENRAGGHDASGVVLSETVPANTHFNAGASTAGWSCAPDAGAGSTCTLAVGNLAAGAAAQSATFAVTVDSPLPAGVSQISNTAAIADDGSYGGDYDPADNSAGDTTPLTGAPDLTLDKSDHDSSIRPGDTLAYELSYANSGNRGASGVVLTETVPAHTVYVPGMSTAGWSCVPDASAGSVCTLAVGTLAAGSSQVAYFALAPVFTIPAGTSQLSNTASISDDGSNGSDPATANNSDTEITPLAIADLSISISNGVTDVTPGTAVHYTIQAGNAGPAAVELARVRNNFPAALTCDWTCSGGAGGSCGAASGTGPIDDSGALPAGATVSYSVSCQVDAAATGILGNTATVASSSSQYDPATDDNSATDDDFLTPRADVELSLSDDRSRAALGQSVDYRIRVRNSGGPSQVTVTVEDSLPAQLGGASWVCVPSGGAACSGGTGTLMNTTATLPVGGEAAYLYSASVIADTPELISNTATATLGAGSDSAPGNNSATDTTLVVLFADGFDSLPLSRLIEARDPNGVALRLTPALKQQLSLQPLTVLAGESARGRLFRLDLARLGSATAARVVTRDAAGHDERSRWQALADDDGLFGFAWQEASAGDSNGYLVLSLGQDLLRIEGRSESEPLLRLRTGATEGRAWVEH